MIAGAAALVAGVIASKSGQQVEAATGSNQVLGNQNTTEATTFVYMDGGAANFAAIETVTDNFGYDNSFTSAIQGHSTGARVANGVFGKAGSSTGTGVIGVAAGNTGAGAAGVAGKGENGVLGISTNVVAGVAGVSGFGNASQNGLSGVGTSGVGNVGVSGRTEAASGGTGVHGLDKNNGGIGVAGEGNNGVQGYGFGTNARGVIGVADAADAAAVKGNSALGTAVAGQITGAGNNHAAVLGNGTAGPGVQGVSTSYYGLVGFTSATDGHSALIGYASAAGGIGLIGNAPGGAFGGGLAGVFNGDVIVNGNFHVYGPTKAAAVKSPTDVAYRTLYCVESPESWFEDFGDNKLTGGVAQVALDAHFTDLIHSDAYRVYLTAEGDSKGLYVSGKTATGFSVREQQGGTSNVAFQWRVVAIRKDAAADHRLKVTKPSPPFNAPTTHDLKQETLKPPVQVAPKALPYDLKPPVQLSGPPLAKPPTTKP